MRRLLLPALLLPFLFAAACDSGGKSIDISGLNDADAAEVISVAICEKIAQCGEVSIECLGSSGGPPTCTGTIEPVSYNECYQDFQPEILWSLECVELTLEQEAILEECVNWQLGLRCPSQSDVDQMARAAEQGTEIPFQDEPPAACDALAELFENCNQPGGP